MDRLFSALSWAIHEHRFDEAEVLLAEGFRRWPTLKTLRVFRAQMHMLQDDFSPKVWKDYHHSWEVTDLGGYQPSAPEWDGRPLAGRTLLIWGPLFGYGDWFMFARLFASAKAQSGATLGLCVPPGLAKMMAPVPGVDWIVEGEIPEAGIDAQLLLSLLPAVTPLTPAHFQRCPYLFADPAAIEWWRPMFADRTVRHVALHWQADQSHAGGSCRSLSLSDLTPLFSVEGVRFYSVQHHDGAAWLGIPKLTDLGQADTPTERFVETAAIVSHVDLVISGDSAITHLAGALGQPAMLMLHVAHDQQWGLRETTLWYPRHRLYRATEVNNWQPVIDRVRRDLERRDR